MAINYEKIKEIKLSIVKKFDNAFADKTKIEVIPFKDKK